ncbi:MAG: hypothetical protein FJ249_02055 [Nitrospira sp.]|nr:hypothetical protein [Nitrospira sp.]
MRRVLAGLWAIFGSVLLSASLALANEPGKGAPDYSGISYMYYTLIALILGYGVYDTFFKKS